MQKIRLFSPDTHWKTCVLSLVPESYGSIHKYSDCCYLALATMYIHLKMYDEAVQEEKRWATYLFSKGSMIGLSEKLLHQFVEYMANRRMKGIQLTPAYDQKTNPLPWVDHWLNSRSTQNAPQETEIESYVIGGIKQDVKKDQFKSFKL